MSCIQTYTGILFDPLHPDPAQIHITDIAHALSLLCRANGHFKTFYSVGQHCINCMHEAVSRGYSHKVQLACLLHDASEAYLSDVTRPVKQELPQYIQIEKPLQEAIWNKYLGEPLTQEEYAQVFSIDDAMLYYEFVALMDTKLTEEVPPLYSTPEVQFMRFESCEQKYLTCFHKLMGSKQEIGSEKSARYQTLVEKVRLSYLTYDGSPDGKNPRLGESDMIQIDAGAFFLVEPSERYAEQISEYRQNFLATNDSMDGCGPLRNYEDPIAYIAECEKYTKPETLPDGLVTANQFLYVRKVDMHVVGMIQVRHYLNDYLSKYGGHIGYSIKPNERRKGYATSMLRAALSYCKEIGISKVLITCHEDNIGGEKTIRNNGGIYEFTVYEPDKHCNMKRFWITLSK